ncbi:PREDICTED: zinc transporter 9 isoform X2 [Nicrophorus vespilloides]|uniref:Proton-coupled zinc antiporter SLC30A9, mitochondrial n=1 Tax=Nicrophorus vespilloides TaxID=110193 RepID=A0ABM1MVE6_NICVS|nr:PREDICTED: zinc transporter 9 isoform X2 [Nicrophorus vespilloides]
MFPRSYSLAKQLCHKCEYSCLVNFRVAKRNYVVYDKYFNLAKCLRRNLSSTKKPEPLEKPKKQAIIDVIAPKIREGEKDTLLKDIKEKSLEGVNVGGKKKEAPVAAEPIAKLKEKILHKQQGSAEDGVPTPQQKKRKRVDFTASSLERNFITPVRAMSDFLLKPSDLETLPKTKRRSPYEAEPPITVYWRRDVEAKALQVWGSRENLIKECIKRDIERKKYQQNIFTVKRRLRDYRREMGKSVEAADVESGLMGRSGKVVLMAVGINSMNFLFKLGAWILTGSHSMFSECIHSLADTINQLILAYGIHKSVQIADSNHPYGYTNMKYVASLISGVGIFCVGTGLSIYHGISGLIDPQPIEDLFWGYFVLGGSLISEGATWYVAFMSVRKGAQENNMSIKDYIFRGQDPSVNVVLLEDAAAVIGVTVAATCMGISSLLNSPIPDAMGSILVGGILGTVASFIIYTNVAALVGRSIPQENLDKINSELESDVMIRAIHDVKGIDMGNYLVRYKAEMDFDGRELTRAYLDKEDLNNLLEEVRKFENIDQLEEFMLKHGEAIVDMLGGEIDRIEMKLRKKHPEIRHCDLEIL